jgi:hypothetical protein
MFFGRVRGIYQNRDGSYSCRSGGGQMKNVLPLALIATLALCGTSIRGEALPLAGSGTGARPDTCRYATDNGCAAANQNGSFQNAALLRSAQQSGQTSLLPKHPMNFNIPGVDYPIGPDKTLTPQDTRNINDGICVFNGTAAVVCQPSVNGQIIHELIDNYDFGGSKIGKATIGLYLQCGKGSKCPAAGSTITVTNNYFSLFPNTNTPLGFSNNWSVIVKNNVFDGSNAVTNSAFAIRDDGDFPGTFIDIEYNVFSNQGVGRVAAGFRNMTVTMKYNFIEGLNRLLTGNHGEVELRTCSQGGCTSTEHYEGNFIVWDTNTSRGVNNATFFPSTGASNGLRLTATSFINNVVVTNTAGTPATPSSAAQLGQALFGQRAASLGIVTITGNWIDATGSTGCGVSGVVNGGDAVTASTSGNTLFVTGTTSSFNNRPIEPGWMIFHSGFATASITAYGTGNGNLGTYTFDGPPQTLGSDSSWTLVPGFASATLAPNWNLADPSHVGTPTAVGFNGPRMRSSSCLGAH